MREVASGATPVALVTVVAVKGSAPRHPGSRMAVRPDGSIVGTVGGGAGEAKARAVALEVLKGREPSVLEVEMTGAEAIGVDLICGGVSTMWIWPVTDPSTYAVAVAAVDRGESVVLVESPERGCLAALGADGTFLAGSPADLDAASPRGGYPGAREAMDELLAEARARQEGALSEYGLLFTAYEPAERLLILGGGHVGRSLARLAAGLSFDVTVADPRPEYSDPGRFPNGVATATMPFEEAIAAFPFDGRTYVVVVSPGHLGDLECARAILSRDYRYAGLIGSKRKVRMLFDQLVAEGFPKGKVEALRAPIGLPIGAETPEEIALSIAAELVAVRRADPSLEWYDGDRRRRRSS